MCTRDQAVSFTVSHPNPAVMAPSLTPSPLTHQAMLLLLALPSLSLAHSTAHHHHHGLIGFGISMYSPPCAFACRHVLAHTRLGCSTPPTADRWHGGSGLGFDTAAACFGGDETYLLSLAWCLRRRCGSPHKHLEGGSEVQERHNWHEGLGGQSIHEGDEAQGLEGRDDVEEWVLQRFWEEDATGDARVKPQWTYSEALARCGEGPARVLEKGGNLSAFVEVKMEDLKEAERGMRDFAWTEGRHSLSGIILLLTTILLPLALDLLTTLLLALFPRLEPFLLGYIILPPLLLHRRSRFLPFTSGLPPTRGQALLILSILLLNAVLLFSGYSIHTPNMHFSTPTAAYISLLANRAGVLALANLAPLTLFAARNNPLLSWTSVPYPTFLLLHRWIAYISIAQAALHAFIFVAVHTSVLSHKFTQPYWILGCIALAIFLLILPASVLPIRQRFYALFLDAHVLLVVAALGGCAAHVLAKFGAAWGYENWVGLAVLVWVLERAGRGWKLLVNGGRRTAEVTLLDDEYVRVDVPGVELGGAVGNAWLYFPSLGWRVWENHPFSVASTVVEVRQVEDVGEEEKPPEIEKVVIGDDEDDEEDSADGTSDDSHDGGDGMNDDNNSDDDDSDDGIYASCVPWAFADHGEPRPRVARERRIQRYTDWKLGRTYSFKWESDDDDAPPANARLLFPNTPNASSPPTQNSPTPPSIQVRPGLSFLIRTHSPGSLTARLASTISITTSLTSSFPILIEPYPPSPALSSLTTSPTPLICIAGGSGIVPLLPLLRARAGAGLGRTVVYWSCRQMALVRATSNIERSLNRDGSGVSMRVRVGFRERWDVRDVVARETGGDVSSGHGGWTVGGNGNGAVTVVVCGPAGMADEVRGAVVEANRAQWRARANGGGTRDGDIGAVRLVEEGYSW